MDFRQKSGRCREVVVSGEVVVTGGSTGVHNPAFEFT